MTLIRLRIKLLRLFSLFLLMSAATGCIGDDLTDCEDIYMLTVRAYDASGSELSTGEVKDVTLFIFDGNNCFVRKEETHIGQHIPIRASSGEQLQIVAWGNLTDGTQTCTEPQPGDPLESCFVELSALSRSAPNIHSPGDLFRGIITLAPQNRSVEVELPMYREVGSMAVTIRSLKTFAGYADDDYSVVVRETHSRIDFDGVLSGNKAAYRPQGSFAAGGEYTVAPFNMLPENTLHIDIYHGTQLITTVSQDSAGNPLRVEKGRLTNVLIDLRASLNVSVQLTDWGKEALWKDF